MSNGSKSVGLYITHEDLLPNDVTDLLQRRADRMHLKGDAKEIGKKASFHSKGLWNIESENHIKSGDVSDHINYILEFVLEKDDAIRLMRERGFSVRMRIHWMLEDDVLSFGLSLPNLMAITSTISGLDVFAG